MQPSRIIFDLTTLVHAGPRNDGICRTIREIAKCAAANWENVVFAAYDAKTSRFFSLRKNWVDEIFRGVALDLSDGLSPEVSQSPNPWQSFLRFTKRPRRYLLHGLEIWRLKHDRHTWLIDWLQSLVMSPKYKALAYD